MSMATAGSAPVERKEVASWRLLALMTSAGAIAGALIVSVYQLTLPRIERHKSEVERAAVLEVLKSPASFDTLYLVNGALVKALGAADAELYTEPLMAEGRTIVTITPKTWHTWDYNKVD